MRGQASHAGDQNAKCTIILRGKGGGGGGEGGGGGGGVGGVSSSLPLQNIDCRTRQRRFGARVVQQDLRSHSEL